MAASIYPAEIVNSSVITIYAGAPYSETVTIVDDDTGEAIPDLANYEMASMLRKLDGTLVATFACAITGATTATRALTDEQTTALTAATNIRHVWGIKLTTPLGVDLPEAQGGAMVRVQVVA